MAKQCKTEKFINNANILHNYKFDYSLTNFITAITKVKIICPIHGVFEQRPHNHISNKQGCPKCVGKNKTNDEFISESKNIHGNIYDYSLIKYINNYSKITIVCPSHGSFEQIPHNHLNGSGCPKCVGKTKTSDEFIKEVNIKHNNKYDYSLVNYENSNFKIKIICSKHGIFEQTATSHLAGRGCPICNESKGEKEISVYLDGFGFEYIRQHKFDDCKNIRHLPFDFYLPDLNICIEYQGEQHYKPVKHFGGENKFLILKENDKIKYNYCSDNKINLITIKHTELNIKRIVDNFIKDIKRNSNIYNKINQ